jgi:hypothetical protein
MPTEAAPLEEVSPPAASTLSEPIRSGCNAKTCPSASRQVQTGNFKQSTFIATTPSAPRPEREAQESLVQIEASHARRFSLDDYSGVY